MAHTRQFQTNLVKLLKPYKGQWVALSQDEKQVLGHGRTIDEALERARHTSAHETPLLVKVPDEGAGFVLI